ncbi:MAG: hypothetical protein GX538_09975, partial [Gammaproteobacteria bacterium]|nr:hypothetical protein [Gammaproteobacteria bacterium]
LDCNIVANARRVDERSTSRKWAMAGVFGALLAVTARGVSADAGASYEVEWFGASGGAPMPQGAVEQLLAEPWLEPVEVRTGAADRGGEPITLQSCSNYLKVADLRVRPVAGGNVGEIFQARALECHAAALTLAAQPAVVSHVRPLAFNEDLPDQLPWQVAMIVSGAETARIAHERPLATWSQALLEPITGFSPCGQYCGTYRDLSQEQTVRLLARGDFDGDGIEDVLVSSWDVALGGSYRATRVLLLTRREPDGKIEMLRELDY